MEKCSPSDTVASDQYGYALDMTARSNGEVYAIVGARFHDRSGTAYLIHHYPSSRQWEHVAQFIPGGASANGGFDGADVSSSYDQFGYAVTISNDWVAISAPLDTASQGKVSLFWLDNVSNGAQLEPDAELVPSDVSYGARFGSTLALDGNTLVIGAAKDRSNVGSAYIYEYNNNAGEWLQRTKIQPDDVSNDSLGNFGTSAVIGQGIVAIGAPMDGTNGRRRNGSVYIYSSSYDLVQTIDPANSIGGDQFGYSLAVGTATSASTNIRETRLAIGARLKSDKGQGSGVVYMYVKRDGESEFSYEQMLSPSEWSPGAEFGTSVDMDEHKIIVGAKKKNGSGGAYYFQYDGTAWRDTGSAVNPLGVGGSSGDAFGSAVALASGLALVGSYSNDEVGVDGGAMYSYEVCD